MGWIVATYEIWIIRDQKIEEGKKIWGDLEPIKYSKFLRVHYVVCIFVIKNYMIER